MAERRMMFSSVKMLLDYRDDLCKLRSTAQRLGIDSEIFLKPISEQIWSTDQKIKNFLRPVEGVARVVNHNGVYYTWAEHGNASWNGLRVIEIPDSGSAICEPPVEM